MVGDVTEPLVKFHINSKCSETLLPNKLCMWLSTWRSGAPDVSVLHLIYKLITVNEVICHTRRGQHVQVEFELRRLSLVAVLPHPSARSLHIDLNVEG